MDGFSSNDNVSIIAATNYPWDIDDAILSRLSTKILCDFPNAEVVTDIIMNTIKKKFKLSKENGEEINLEKTFNLFQDENKNKLLEETDYLQSYLTKENISNKK